MIFIKNYKVNLILRKILIKDPIKVKKELYKRKLMKMIKINKI